MKISYIITISPVVPINYLNFLIHSLNIQSDKDFNVIFYNQINDGEIAILNQLEIKPEFEFLWFDIEKKYFMGKYPIWNLYSFHQYLLENDYLNDYFISLHSEEFLDTDYTKNVIEVLSRNKIDILLGNLNWIKYDFNGLKNYLSSKNGPWMYVSQIDSKLFDTVKWGLSPKIFNLSKNPFAIIKSSYKTILKMKRLGGSKNIKLSESGFTKLGQYILEDVYFMKRDFAIRTGWFNSDIELFFEDIHINFKLGEKLSTITEFPLYFNKNKIYHLQQSKHYYQIVDTEFATNFLKFETENPILLSLKEGIKLYQNNTLSLREALRYSRKNSYQKGASDINIKKHLQIINELT